MEPFYRNSDNADSKSVDTWQNKLDDKAPAPSKDSGMSLANCQLKSIP